MGKNLKHGPLYEHALRELESAGITVGKGNMDQKVSSTVLKLVDIYEHNGTSELIRSMVRNLFVTFSAHDIINPPTDNPDEWTLIRDAEGDYLVLRRCTDYRSRDGGISWYRQDGAAGLSIKSKEGELDAVSQEEKNV